LVGGGRYERGEMEKLRKGKNGEEVERESTGE